MKVNRNRKIKSFIFINNFNVVYEPYYKISNGIYKFFDKVTKLKFMYKFGITCGCQRKIINNELKYCYDNIEITARQKEFLKKRTIALQSTLPNGVTFIKHECGCKKNEKR